MVISMQQLTADDIYIMDKGAATMVSAMAAKLNSHIHHHREGACS